MKRTALVSLAVLLMIGTGALGAEPVQLQLLGVGSESGAGAEPDDLSLACDTLDEIDRTAPGPDDGTTAVAHAAKDLVWERGTWLRVAFLGGTKQERETVTNTGREWSAYANIKFAVIEANPEDAEIRISFADAGTWSAIGRRALAKQPSEATMNIGSWFEARRAIAQLERQRGSRVDLGTELTTTRKLVRRAILHEFGHALGLIHEHQAPKSGIAWNIDALRRRVAATRGLTGEALEQCLKDNYLVVWPQANLMNGNTYDPTSIMHYSIPRSWTRNGQEVKTNWELSERDKKYIARCYPRDA
jgi:serralysin